MSTSEFSLETGIELDMQHLGQDAYSEGDERACEAPGGDLQWLTWG